MTTYIWEMAVHLAVGGDVFYVDGALFCAVLFATRCFG